MQKEVEIKLRHVRVFSSALGKVRHRLTHAQSMNLSELAQYAVSRSINNILLRRLSTTLLCCRCAVVPLFLESAQAHVANSGQDDVAQPLHTRLGLHTTPHHLSSSSTTCTVDIALSTGIMITN